ncbi:hypothetical protein RHMOL_Rhmol08G0024700 [Rhododendron molle]|uniref:Uncharacterized protein n=1 Tax=Rhododendron molle TaxID=49168 RepID=A0ACC0MJ13_RHOML|nr:hypothetical protein RHMOL_Rhmol08G0024700 [Rhododendron molle]
MAIAVKLRIIITAVLLYFTAVASQNLTIFTATYGPFNYSYRDIFDLENSATIFHGALRLTPNLAYQKGLLRVPLENLSGRVMLKQPFKLWEQGYNKTPDRVASFNSSFLFSVYPLGRNTTPGEGLAFFLAPHLSLPSNSSGQYLGLTNIDTDGSLQNRLVAIEFDNVKQAFDPDANHVGLNVLQCLGPIRRGQQVIEVYIAQQSKLHGETPSKPDKPVLKSNLDLSGVLDQYSYFGFSASTGDGVQYNNVYRWNLTVDSYSDDAPEPQYKHTPWKKTLLVVGVAIPLLMMGVGLTGYYYLRKKRSMAQSDVFRGALRRLPDTPREFRFKDLKKATNNFDEKNKLGEGSFGVVYRGHLQNENENLEVAVKWFCKETVKGQQDEFWAELTIINRLRHKHLVRLLGKATQQSDVYAFGAVLLEIVCGLRPVTRIDEFPYLLDWVRCLHREGRILDAVEERLGNEYDAEEAEKVLILALACSHPIPSQRPETQAIVQILSGLMPVSYVPPF